MENLMDYVILAFLFMGLMAFFGAYAIGMMTLRAAVNGCVAVFGADYGTQWQEVAIPSQHERIKAAE